MKRIVTFFLTLALLVSSASLSSVYVLAASGDNGNEIVELSEQDGSVEGSASFDVTGSYAPASDREAVYKVVITWGDLNFQYDPGTLTWNPHSLTYTNGTSYGWKNGSSDTVKVENLSNVAVTVSASVSQEDSSDHNVTVTVNSGPKELIAAWDGMPRNQAPNADFVVSVSGTGRPDPKAEANKPVKVGTVTLTVSGSASP